MVTIVGGTAFTVSKTKNIFLSISGGQTMRSGGDHSIPPLCIKSQAGAASMGSLHSFVMLQRLPVNRRKTTVNLNLP